MWNMQVKKIEHSSLIEWLKLTPFVKKTFIKLKLTPFVKKLYIINAQNLIFYENIIENYTLVREKHENIVSRAIGTIPIKSLIFVKLKLLY
jgi:hypothetical protein